MIWLYRLDRKAALIGLGLFALALLLRFIGIGWGLPGADRAESLHPDEGVVAAYSRQVQPAQLKFTPGFYNYGTLYLSLMRVSGDVAMTYSPPTRKEGDTPAVAIENRASEFRTILTAGRSISALAGAALAWVVFLMLYRRTHLWGAIFAGLSVGLTPGLVVHSRFATVDVLATLLAALSLLFALKLAPPAEDPMPEGSAAMKLAVWAGVFAGLSAGVKYTGILAILCLATILLAQKRKEALAWIGAGFGSAVGVFLLATPGVLLDFGRFWDDFRYEMVHTATGHGTVFAATAPGFIYHLLNIIEAFGLILLVMGVAGLARLAWKKEPWAFGLIAFALAYYVLIGRAEVKFLRYVFPLLPVLAVGAGWLAGQAHTHPKQPFKLIGLAAILGLGGLLGGGLTRTVAATSWMAGEDPRDSAAKWIRQNAKPGETVGLVKDPWFYTASLYPQAQLALMIPYPLRTQFLQEAGPPRVIRHLPADPDQRIDWDVELLTQDKPDYVVFSSFESDDMVRIRAVGADNEIDKLLVSRFESFWKQMEKDYEPSAAMIFGSDGPSIHDMMYIRPKVWIWKRKADSSTTSSGSSTTSGASGAPASTPSTPTGRT